MSIPLYFCFEMYSCSHRTASTYISMVTACGCKGGVMSMSCEYEVVHVIDKGACTITIKLAHEFVEATSRICSPHFLGESLLS